MPSPRLLHFGFLLGAVGSGVTVYLLMRVGGSASRDLKVMAGLWVLPVLPFWGAAALARPVAGSWLATLAVYAAIVGAVCYIVWVVRLFQDYSAANVSAGGAYMVFWLMACAASGVGAALVAIVAVAARIIAPR